jgi:3-phenylpropionate/trans-cinnamate dioxygenase ferredoxin reductase subunit
VKEANARVVILGAGHAGGTAAALLRQYGWIGSIALVGEEPLPPYQRPPLSKAWLKGEATAESLALRPLSFYAQRSIDLHLTTRAMQVDRRSKLVWLDDGSGLPYDYLVLALGSSVATLSIPGAGLDGILSLRTAADADRLNAALGAGKRLAIIGGGYVGLEVAASTCALGVKVTLIEREPRVLSRTASPLVSEFLQTCHRTRGVKLELGATISALTGSNGRVASVRLVDGRSIPCDVALVGVGAKANDGLAQVAGLECDGGIVVDHNARTTDPSIFAIGDCTRRHLPLYERFARLESVQNALEQAKQAAAVICRRPSPPAEVPWFWSDQFDLRLQIAGLPFDASEQIVRGDPASSQFSVFHLAVDRRVLAVETINSASDFVAGRALIARRAQLNHKQLQDLSLSLKEGAA